MRTPSLHWKNVITSSTKLFESRAAIWDKNRRILGTCIGAWLVNLAFIIRCTRDFMLLYRRSQLTYRRFLVALLPQVSHQYAWVNPLSSFSPPLNRRPQTKARHSKALKSCVLRDGRLNRDTTLATLCSEMILLTFMLAGLVRQRDHYLGRLLFHHVNTAFFLWVSRGHANSWYIAIIGLGLVARGYICSSSASCKYSTTLISHHYCCWFACSTSFRYSYPSILVVREIFLLIYFNEEESLCILPPLSSTRPWESSE